MQLIHILSQEEVDLLTAHGLLSEQLFLTPSHREGGQDYYTVSFSTKEAWEAVYRFLHPDA